jgi:hypothetical protein
MARTACFHAVKGYIPGRHPRYGQRVTVISLARRGTKPRNILIEFTDGARVITSYGCLRWKCNKHRGAYMQCKTCDKGLVLQSLAHRKEGNVTITLEPVVCDCCGGYFEHCENCEAGEHIIDWLDNDATLPPALQRSEED